MNSTTVEKEGKDDILEQMRASGWQVAACDTAVPYFRNGVPAGYPQEPGDYDGEYVAVPRELLKRCDFVVTVRGDSMKDAGIDDGDDVMVKSCDVYDDGDVVVALLDGETTLKAYCRDQDGEEGLVPANEAYEPIRLADYQTVYVLGRVTSVRKKTPRASFAALQRRLREARRKAVTAVTDEAVRSAVAQVLADIRVSRMWFCIYRVLADVGYLPRGNYEALKTKMDELFPDNDFGINPRDISRMDVDSFSKGLQLWSEHNAPVTGKRYRDYLSLATVFYRLLKG